MIKNFVSIIGTDPKLPVIDLHGIRNVSVAIEQLEKELFLFFNMGARYVRVVHGIGGGTLAAAVHSALQKNPLIREFHEEDSGGSCLVVF